MIFIPRNLLITAAFLTACVFAMGFYVLHLKRQSEETSARMSKTFPPALLIFPATSAAAPAFDA